METHADEYVTIRGRTEAALTVRGSRFLALAAPVVMRDGCEAEIRAARGRYHDATHHCYAYRLGPDGAQFRAHDDGEPAGSAGRPILAVIDGAGLLGVIVVVTRYFGGTKLGVGGLARAYRDASALAVARAERTTRVVCSLLGVSFPHACVGPVMRAVAAAGGRVSSAKYDSAVEMEIEIRTSRLEELRSALLERTSGEIRFSRE